MNNMKFETEVTNVALAMRPKINALVTRLKRENALKGEARKGSSLNTKVLVKTFAAVQSGFENEDRYKTNFIKPEISVGLAVALDCSGSMDAPLYPRRPGGGVKRVGGAEARALLTTGQSVAAAAAALQKTLPRDVLTRASIAFVDYEGDGVGGVRAIEYPLSERGETIVPPTEWGNFNMTSGTSIETYAWSALRRAASMDATYKVAVYMTDGDCNTIAKLPSINEQAKRMGVTLVGVVMGNDVDPDSVPHVHPNGVFCASASHFGQVIAQHLERVLLKKGG